MKAPAFQFYPQDFISSLDVQVMTVEQVGAYWLLLTNAWIHEPQGYLPNNELLLQRICRMNDKQWSKNKSLILKKFEKDGELIFNARLIKELEKQGEYRKKQAQNGAKGGRPKANVNPEKPTALSGLTQTKAKKSSSISTSSSSSISPSDKEDKSSSSGSGEPKKEKRHALLDMFEEITGRKFQVMSAKTERQFKLLRKTFEFEDFRIAIKNGYASSQRWDDPNNFTPEYITREDKFLQFYNWGNPGRPVQPEPTKKQMVY